MRNVIVAFAVMLMGCFVEVETSGVEQQTGTQCPPWACSNSAEVIPFGMHEANLVGLPNTQGIYIKSISTFTGTHAQIEKAGESYDLYVRGGFVTARRGTTELRGGQLVGAELPMMRNGVELFRIRIDRVRPMTYPVGTASALEAYQLSWRSTGTTDWRSVCDPTANALGDPLDLLGMDASEAVIFEGDRINAQAKTVNTTPDVNWFNIGCAGYSLAKLRLTRNTIAHNTDWRARQATLKMFVADYCGTGMPFTVDGTPIRWKGGLVDYYSPPGQIEARWTANGAACLTTPRLVAWPNAKFPDVRTAIAESCTIPWCSGSPYDLQGYPRISAIPQ